MYWHALSCHLLSCTVVYCHVLPFTVMFRAPRWVVMLYGGPKSRTVSSNVMSCSVIQLYWKLPIPDSSLLYIGCPKKNFPMPNERFHLSKKETNNIRRLFYGTLKSFSGHAIWCDCRNTVSSCTVMYCHVMPCSLSWSSPLLESANLLSVFAVHGVKVDVLSRHVLSSTVMSCNEVHLYWKMPIQDLFLLNKVWFPIYCHVMYCHVL